MKPIQNRVASDRIQIQEPQIIMGKVDKPDLLALPAPNLEEREIRRELKKLKNQMRSKPTKSVPHMEQGGYSSDEVGNAFMTQYP